MVEKKTLSMPAWQKASAEKPPSQPPADTAASDEQSDARLSRDTLLDQARQFLEDPSIKNAATEKKTAFLETKGLRQDEIQQLLSSEFPSSTETASTTSSINLSEIKTIHDTSSGSEKSPSGDQETLSPSPPPASSSTSPPPNPTPTPAPPIITYPEFLLQAQNPPPLITLRHLLYTVYLLAGLGATVHGTGKYLVTPLLAALTDARHSFFQSTHSNLQTLNNKLFSSVSHIPVNISSKPFRQDDKDNESEISSQASDPTELFHRDIATQTSPSLPTTLTSPTTTTSSSSSSSSSSTADPFHPFSSSKTLSKQASSLTHLSTHLRSLLSSSEFASDPLKGTSISTSTDNLSNSLSSLKSYLDNLSYGASSSSYYDRTYAGVYDFNSNSTDRDRATGGTSAAAAGTAGAGLKLKKEKEEDEISKFKAEIRTVKGALLSARNFPIASNTRTVAAGSGQA